MKKQFRLGLQRDFDNIFKNGRSASLGGLVLKYLPNNRSFSRLAVIVSQKVAKKSTKRNLLRRRLKEIVKKHLTDLRGWDIILITKAELIQKDFNQLTEAVEKILKKAKLSR